MHVFRVEGLPKPQPRAKATTIAGKPRIYTPSTAKAWRSAVCRAAHEARIECLPGAVGFYIDFLIPRPKSHYRAVRRNGELGPLRPNAPDFPPAQAGDIDNLVKSTWDALKGVAWIDDGQVIASAQTKRYVDHGHPGGAAITIDDLTGRLQQLRYAAKIGPALLTSEG
jgi:Holliday junction resolvase RusA-like endonuclease